MTFQEYYTPFGEVINASAENDNQAGFTGHIRDTATGLTYMQARYYDPNIGRFLSIDPVTFLDTGNPAMFNRYAYAFNDPINLIDPDGMAPGDRFETPDEAGYDAINTVNPKSISENKEYGGVINREVSEVISADGTTSEKVEYYATEPVQGDGDSVQLKGSKSNTVGDYHTHGDYSRTDSKGNIVRTTKGKDEFNSDNRSKGKSADSGNTKLLGKATQAARAEYGETYKSYLGTPSGEIKVYTYKDKK